MPRAVISALGGATTFALRDKTGLVRLEASIDDKQNLKVFIFDGEGQPRQGWVSLSDRRVQEFKDSVDSVVPTSDSTDGQPKP